VIGFFYRRTLWSSAWHSLSLRYAVLGSAVMFVTDPVPLLIHESIDLNVVYLTFSWVHECWR